MIVEALRVLLEAMRVFAGASRVLTKTLIVLSPCRGVRVVLEALRLLVCRVRGSDYRGHKKDYKDCLYRP